MTVFLRRPNRRCSPISSLSSALTRYVFFFFLFSQTAVKMRCPKNNHAYPALFMWLHTFVPSRKRRTLVKSGRSSTTASAAASPCSITPTTANCCTPTTCSRWWRCSSPTWPWTRRCASSAKCLETTSITATRTVTRDASTSRSKSTLYDRRQDNNTFPECPPTSLDNTPPVLKLISRRW